MHITYYVVIGLLAAFALVGITCSFGYPVGRFIMLWQSVPAEDWERVKLFSPASEKRLCILYIGVFLLPGISRSVVDLLDFLGVHLPGMAAFLKSPKAVAFHLACCGCFLLLPLLWSWRVLRLPHGQCGAAVRRVAWWIFPLCVGSGALGAWLLVRDVISP